jgi:hypothetical protein
MLRPMSNGANKPPVVEKHGLKSQLLGGSLTLLAGSGLVGITNLVYNVATAPPARPYGIRTRHRRLYLADVDVGGHSFVPGRLREICSPY